MTEAEWLVSTDPQPMLKFLARGAADRKLLMLAVACCRRIWRLFEDERCRNAVAVSELAADGSATEISMHAAAWSAWKVARDAAASIPRGEAPPDLPVWRKDSAAAAWLPGLRGLTPNAASKAISCVSRAVARHAGGCGDPAREAARRREKAEQSNLVRDIFANPLRPALAVDPAWLAWHGGAVRELALALYDDRRMPEGTLEPVRLAVLADALEDAGCSDADLLGHLRGPGPHVRGCWTVDLILSKDR
jgi:hypothetical protein